MIWSVWSGVNALIGRNRSELRWGYENNLEWELSIPARPNEVWTWWIDWTILSSTMMKPHITYLAFRGKAPKRLYAVKNTHNKKH